MELKQIVKSFIDKASEGGYWDFKQSWHINNADLLKDIICMANNTTIDMQDGYIIFGIENSRFNITGVSSYITIQRDNNYNLEVQIGEGRDETRIWVMDFPYLFTYIFNWNIGEGERGWRAKWDIFLSGRKLDISLYGVQATRQSYYHIEPNTYWLKESGLCLNKMTDSIKYYAYIRDSIEFLAFELFFTKQCYEGREAYGKALMVIPIFENEQEHINFMNYVKSLAIEFKADVEEQNVDEMFPDYAKAVDTAIVYKLGKTLVEWLYQWR